MRVSRTREPREWQSPVRRFRARLGETLKLAASTLQRDGVDFLLGGSLAAWVRGGPESCNDLDLIIRPEDAERALASLERAGMRAERPPERWLVKAWHGDLLVDLIFHPVGIELDDRTFERADTLTAFGLDVKAMALEDVIVTKLLALGEHYLDYEGVLQMTRPVRGQIDWDDVRDRTAHSPHARAFMTLVEGLGLLDAGREARRHTDHARVRLAGAGRRAQAGTAVRPARFFPRRVSLD